MGRREETPDDGAALIAQVAAGDAEALGRLYDVYGGLAYGLAKRLLHDAPLAQEVVQDAFLAIWRHARRFDPKRGSVRPWLLTVVHHRCVNLLRDGRAKGMGIVLAETEPPPEPDGVWHPVAQRLAALDLRQALMTLPNEQREVVLLAYFDGFTHQQIAAQLGLPLGTVKGRMRLALRKLRAVLDGTEAGPPLAEGR